MACKGTFFPVTRLTQHPEWDYSFTCRVGERGQFYTVHLFLRGERGQRVGQAMLSVARWTSHRGRRTVENICAWRD